MNSDLPIVIDANVLIQVRDTLLRLAERRRFCADGPGTLLRRSVAI